MEGELALEETEEMEEQRAPAWGGQIVSFPLFFCLLLPFSFLSVGGMGRWLGSPARIGNINAGLGWNKDIPVKACRRCLGSSGVYHGPLGRM